MNQSDLSARFGASVRRLRFRMGISQEELAGRADLHRTYIAGIERGGRNITLKSIEKLAKALEVSTAELLSPAITSRQSAAKDSTSQGPAFREILLIQGDSQDAAMTLQTFSKAGIANPVHVVRNATAALDYIFGMGSYAHRKGEKLPPVVLLDLKSLKINGLDILRRLKRHPTTQKMPVIVLTMSQTARELAACHRLGVSTYVTKPIDFHNFSQVTPGLRLQWALTEPAAMMRA